MSRSNFPATRAEMLSQGYSLIASSSTCKGCGLAIEWWMTQNGKKIPMNLMASDDATALPHWINCAAGADFKRNAGTHRCAALNCEQQVSLTLLMCPAHWARLSQLMQGQVRLGWRRFQADPQHFWHYALAREQAVNSLALADHLRSADECCKRECNLRARIEPQGGLFA
jgi:hypothetical protein